MGKFKFIIFITFLILFIVMAMWIYYQYKYDFHSANQDCKRLGYKSFGGVVIEGNPDGSIKSLEGTCLDAEGARHIIGG